MSHDAQQQQQQQQQQGDHNEAYDHASDGGAEQQSQQRPSLARQRKSKGKGLEAHRANKKMCEPATVEDAILHSLMCCVCERMLRDPVTLPCGHAVCGACCQSLMGGQAQHAMHVRWSRAGSRRLKFACPIDNRPFSRDMVLSISVHLRTILAIVSSQQQQQQQVVHHCLE